MTSRVGLGLIGVTTGLGRCRGRHRGRANDKIRTGALAAGHREQSLVIEVPGALVLAAILRFRIPSVRLTLNTV